MIKIGISFLVCIVSFASYGASNQKTEVQGYGRCPYCDHNVTYIEDRTVNTNPDALSMLHQAMGKADVKRKSSKPVTRGLR